MLRPQSAVSLAAAAAIVLSVSPAARADRSSPEWGPGQLVLASAGCPIETPDGLSLMVASGRPGGQGDLDIWVIDRPAIGADWSLPKNLPPPINSPAADFCPAPRPKRTPKPAAAPAATATSIFRGRVRPAIGPSPCICRVRRTGPIPRARSAALRSSKRGTARSCSSRRTKGSPMQRKTSTSASWTTTATSAAATSCRP